MPTTQSTFRPELGVLAYEFSQDASRQGFIGLQVLPVFEADRQSAEYPVIPARAMLEMQDTARAPRSAYARGDYDFESAEYFCREHGWEEPLDDTEAQLYKHYFDAETVAVQRATLMVLRSQEKRVVDATIGNDALPRGAVAHAWSGYADADPLADVNKAKEHFRFSVGLQANALILDADILRHVSMCEAVMERVKYTSPNALRGELAGIGFIHHRLRQPPADEQIRLLGRRETENQDSSPDSGAPQGDALLQRGDGKRSHAAAAQSAGTGDGSVSVSVRLDHRHQRTVCSRFSLEQEGVGAQSTQIDFAPRAAGFRGAAGQEKDGAQRDRRTEQQHGKKMSQTVPHQNRFQSQHFRGSAHQYNAPGVHDIKHSGETAGVPILFVRCSG